MRRLAFFAALWSLSAQAAPIGYPAAKMAMAGILEPGDEAPLAGLAAIRLHEGRETFAYFGGIRHFDGNRTWPVQRDTLFRVASVSKLVTTIGLMQLVEQGRVNLDHDVSEYVGFRLRNPTFPDRPITLRMLLDHTSSIRDAAAYTVPPMTPIASLFDTTHPVGTTGYHFSNDPTKPPGTWFEYCNLGYGIVGTIIERQSGERFDHYMRHHVLEPLGIESGYNVFELPHPDRLSTLYQRTARGWAAEFDDWPPTGWHADDLEHYQIGSNGTMFSPQGGLRISMPDLARVARLMMGRGKLDGVRLLKPETVLLMERANWQYDGHNGLTGEGGAGPFDRYGLTVAWLTGWIDAKGKGDRPYLGYRGGLRGHLGDAYALHSGLWYDPEHGDAYVFAATGYPADDSTERGDYSYFTRTEERIFTVLSRVGTAPSRLDRTEGASRR